MHFNENKTEAVKLWDGFRKGDKKSFSLLYENYFSSLYNYGRALIRDENIIKDCIQDLFVKFYKNRKKLPTISYPKVYMLYSLKNLIIDTLIKNRRMEYIAQNDLFFSTIEYQDWNNAFFEEEEEEKKNFESITNVLNFRQKEAVCLRFMEGLSYDEISVLMGITYQSARNLIHRAISKIREKQAETSEYKS